MFDIKENLKKLPKQPGVYIHKDAVGQVLYVGKAGNLSNRVRQYFQSERNQPAKVRALVKHISSFEYIVCSTEAEALILENNLIKKHMPPYNVLLRDDKTYPYIKVTDQEKYPRLLKTRLIEKDGSRYYGPFGDTGAVNEMVEILNKVYKLKRCKYQKFTENFRPCLHYFIGECEGMCKYPVSVSDYRARVREVEAFMKGKDHRLERFLKNKMQEAAEDLNYEEAAKYRDYLRSAEALHEVQSVEIVGENNLDMVVWLGEGQVVVFYVREGKLVGRQTYELDNWEADVDDNEAVSDFIKQHYHGQTDGPKEIAVAEPIPDAKLIGEALSMLWGHKVEITRPQRGPKKALMDMAKVDAENLRQVAEDRVQVRRKRQEKLHGELSQIISKAGGSQEVVEQKEPYRVETYDISNMYGIDAVGSMVVFDDLKANRSAYRKFKVRTTDGPDDYQSMKEVLFRRLKRGLDGDEAFLPMPDLLLIDGGRGHLSSVQQVQEALGTQIPMVGLVKNERHRTRGMVFLKRQDGEDFFKEELLEGRGVLYSYLGKLQEEAHRFAIDFHRSLRSKKTLRSVLDEIDGIGPARRQALLRELGSVENISKASLEELRAVESMNDAAAENVYNFFKKND